MSGGASWGLSRSESKDDIWGPQEDRLRALYSASEGMFNGGQDKYIDAGLSAGQQGIDQMGGSNQQTQNPWSQQLQGGFANDSYMQNFLQGGMQGEGEVFDSLRGLMNPEGNPYMQQMGQYGLDQMNQNFQNNIMPGINTNAVFSGGLGGSRQGIAQGSAASGIANESANYLNNFYGSQYQSDMNRAAQATGMFGDLQSQAGQGYQGLLGMQDTNQANALGMTPQMLQNQMAPAQSYLGMSEAQWSPYHQYSQAIGPPVVLNESFSRDFRGSVQGGAGPS